MTNNLKILEQIKELWNPKTAFGNDKIIKLLKEFTLPNQDGIYEIEGIISQQTYQTLDFDCINCGRSNHISVDNERYQDSDIYDTRCINFKAKLAITLYAG